MSTRNARDVQESYGRVKAALLAHEHTFYSAPTSPQRPKIAQTGGSSSSSSLPPTISSLSVHPVLEVGLHLANADLTAAHFLVRHAQAAPAYESMYLHGILHRVEGDVDNARAWYGDVQDAEVFRAVWGGPEAAEAADGGVLGRGGWRVFLGRVERWRDSVRARKGSKVTVSGDRQDAPVDWEKEKAELSEISLEELKSVMAFCEKKFGISAVDDASSEYTMSGEKHKDIAAEMIMGGEGWREF